METLIIVTEVTLFRINVLRTKKKKKNNFNMLIMYTTMRHKDVERSRKILNVNIVLSDIQFCFNFN